MTFMDEAERQSKRGSPGPATYYPKVRRNIMQNLTCKDAHERMLNVLKVCAHRLLASKWGSRGASARCLRFASQRSIRPRLT